MKGMSGSHVFFLSFLGNTCKSKEQEKKRTGGPGMCGDRKQVIRDIALMVSGEIRKTREFQLPPLQNVIVYH